MNKHKLAIVFENNGEPAMAIRLRNNARPRNNFHLFETHNLEKIYFRKGFWLHLVDKNYSYNDINNRILSHIENYKITNHICCKFRESSNYCTCFLFNDHNYKMSDTADFGNKSVAMSIITKQNYYLMVTISREAKTMLWPREPDKMMIV